MFTGLSAFPVTPFKHGKPDLVSYEKLISNLVEHQVDSIGALGSTGMAVYLSAEERRQVAKRTVELASSVPVITGISALCTRDVLTHLQNAQHAGVSAVLLSPYSYHRLDDAEVLGLFEKVSQESDVPIVVYDNPKSTGFNFSLELYREIANLKNVASFKIPGFDFETLEGGVTKLAQTRRYLPESCSIGISGDRYGYNAMNNGCDLWYSVLGGLFPQTVKQIIKSAQAKITVDNQNELEILWELFVKYRGGVRVVATLAEFSGYVEGNCLPEPLLPVTDEDRKKLKIIWHKLSA